MPTELHSIQRRARRLHHAFTFDQRDSEQINQDDPFTCPSTLDVPTSRRVTGEDIVAILSRLVAGEAGLVQRLVARFAVREVGESPAGGRGVLLRVLDHELDIHGGTGDEGLEARTGEAGG